jgi:aminobenzoyl-glutamate utilization protein B
LTQRSHYVITNGGDQPNVVPPNASVWYYFREADYDHIKALWDIGNNMAQGASLMTNTTWKSRVLGEAWPGYFNKPIADAAWANINKVGLPNWTEDDQKLAKALQQEIGTKETGLATKLRPPKEKPPEEPDAFGQEPMPIGGGSDDISVTFRGMCRRLRWAIRPIFQVYQGTTGPMVWLWRLPSHTKV